MHHRSNFVLSNNTAIYHSSSHSISYLPSLINSNKHYSILNQKQNQDNATLSQQNLVDNSIDNEKLLNYTDSKALNKLKQRTYRVRKSRILIPFDQTEHDNNNYHLTVSDDDRTYSNKFVDNALQDISTEINRIPLYSLIHRTKSALIYPVNNSREATKVCLLN